MLRTLTARYFQTSFIIQMDVCFQESLGYQGFVNPSFFGIMVGT